MSHRWIVAVLLVGLNACSKGEGKQARGSSSSSSETGEEAAEIRNDSKDAAREVTLTKLAHQLSEMMPKADDPTVDLKAVKALMSGQLGDSDLALAYTVDYTRRTLTYCWRGLDGGCDDSLYQDTFGVPIYVDDGSWQAAMEILDQRAAAHESDPRMIFEAEVRGQALKVFAHPIHPPDITFLPGVLKSPLVKSDSNFRGWVVLGYQN